MYLIQEPYVRGDHVLFRTCEYLENRRVLGYRLLVLSELSINFVPCNSSDTLKGADFLHSSQNALQIERLRAHRAQEHPSQVKRKHSQAAPHRDPQGVRAGAAASPEPC